MGIQKIYISSKITGYVFTSLNLYVDALGFCTYQNCLYQVQQDFSGNPYILV